MKIVYIGRVSLKPLAERFRFERPFPEVKWGFGIGSDLVSGLVQRGHEVHVITLDNHYRKVESWNSGALTVHLVPGRATKWQFLTFYWREVRTMRWLIREIKPDVVFAQWTYENAYAGLSSGFPTLCVGHDSPWTVLKTFRNWFALFRAIYAQLFVLPRMKHLSVVSPHIEEDFRKQCGYKGGSVLIPNGIRTGGRLEVEGWTKEIRREAKTIVCVSQAGRLKNALALIKAFAMLRVKHPDWRLKIYGQGLPDGLATRAELDRVLREEADVFCSPSLEESFGMVFVEAMLQGVPCVGGEKSGAVPWVMGEGGVTCDVTKPEKLAECLERVILDYDLRKHLSESGQKRVRELFNIEKAIDAYEEELMRVVKEGLLL